MSNNASANEVYAKLLLPKRHGYPLWIPEPDCRLPLEYREQGVTIGDVGIVTFDGGFDFLFNICLPANHPINSNRVPEGFQPLALGERDIRTTESMHKPGSCVASAQIKAIKLTIEAATAENPAVPIAAGGGFRFACSTSEGAILVLPNGGSREDMYNVMKFRQYAIQHACDWYRLANSPSFGRDTPNGSLYLVTGCDKASSWGVASFANASNEGGLSFNFTAASVGEGLVSYDYSWQDFNSIDCRAGQGLIGGQLLQNQCVFLRGFKITIHDDWWAKLTGRIAEASLVHESKSKDVLKRSGWVPFATYGRQLSSSSDPTRSTAGSGTAGQSDAIQAVVAHNPEIQTPYHPSDIINRFMLNKSPHAQVAVTHDDVWCSLIDNDTDTFLPDELQMLQRFQRKYTVDLSEDGVFPCCKYEFPWMPIISSINNTSTFNIINDADSQENSVHQRDDLNHDAKVYRNPFSELVDGTRGFEPDHYTTASLVSAGPSSTVDNQKRLHIPPGKSSVSGSQSPLGQVPSTQPTLLNPATIVIPTSKGSRSPIAHGKLNHVAVDLPRSQTATKGGCWTCRLRRKRCDEQREKDSCRTCSRLNIQCLGWSPKRPDWMRDKQMVDAYKTEIGAQLRRAGFIRGQPQPPPMQSSASSTVILSESHSGPYGPQINTDPDLSTSTQKLHTSSNSTLDFFQTPWVSGGSSSIFSTPFNAVLHTDQSQTVQSPVTLPLFSGSLASPSSPVPSEGNESD